MVDAHTQPYRTPATGYTPVARALHWITAAIVLGMIPAGIYMANVEGGPLKDLLYHLHRSFGVVLLPLILVRLVYRLTNPPPPLPPDLPPIQQFAAHANHWGLYALLILQPILGWVATSAYRAPVLVFWLFELPPIWKEDRAFSEQMFAAHRFVGIAIAFLAVGHIGAALFHHFVRKDEILMRMVRG